MGMVVLGAVRRVWLVIERLWGIDELPPDLRRMVLQNTRLFALLMAAINGFYLLLFLVILD